jgi:ribosome biogenesis protein Nip4
MKELPRAFVEKLKSLNFELIRDIVGEYLKDKEINAVLLRRDLILEVVNKRIKKFGEDKVLY